MLDPAALPVTRPEPLTLATDEEAETHALLDADVPEPVNCVVDPIQVVNEPVIVGSGFTVMVAVVLQPLLLV